LFAQLIDDAAMFPPGNAPAAAAVADHRAYGDAWFASLVGPLVVPDDRLAEVGSAARQLGSSVSVSVVNTAGAGGLVALARRAVDGVQVVAVESALRDLDDLEGNAQRVVAAAAELDAGVPVFVELPYAPGWDRAVAVVEKAGCLGKIRTGGTVPADHPNRPQLADQLSVLVEADLPFKATAGLHRAWPNTVANAHGEALDQHGFLTVMIALAALVDGANRTEAAQLMGVSDRDQIAATIGGWDDAAVARVRRRFRSFGCCGVRDPVADLEALGLVTR
jgi:hypothetical protein